MSDLSAALEIISQYARRLFRVVSAVCEEVDFFFCSHFVFFKGIGFFLCFFEGAKFKGKELIKEIPYMIVNCCRKGSG